MIIVDDATRHALAVVHDAQFSLAIGRQGLNVRLANRLVDWNIDVRTRAQVADMDLGGEKKREAAALFSEDEAQEIDRISELPGVPERIAAALAEQGMERIEDLVEIQYREAGPQLLLQAFLQRIVNSGGRVEREYGLGRMRTDLLIVWPAGAPPEPSRKMVIECKVLRGSLERTIREGLEQTRACMDRCAAAEGHLVIFDRTPGKAWQEKLFRRQEPGSGPPITVWGM